MPDQDTPTISQLDIAWAAGLFEGEGCFNSMIRKRNSTETRAVQARLTMTDRDVVERFYRIVGVGRFYGHGRQQRGNRKRAFDWAAQEAREVVHVIDLLLPYLGERRRDKALEVRFIAAGIRPHDGLATHCPKGHPYEGDNLVVEVARRVNAAGEVVEQEKRRCKTCRQAQGRDRARRRLGIEPENYRVKEAPGA